MANTYTQLYIQIVFAVRYRRNAIREEYRVPLEKYITGIVTNNKSKLLAIYCNPDHVHILLGLDPSISISAMARDIKANSSKWMNEERIKRGNFRWQKGFGAFSYSKSQVDRVIKYILNQPNHHRKKGFREEYLKMLNKLEIQYAEKYLFDWYD